MKDLLNITFGQFVGGGVGIIFLVSLFIEITPIKWNPISSLLGVMGRIANKPVLEKVEEMNKKVDWLETAVKESNDRDDLRNAIACRRNILAFGDELRRGVKHSHESFTQILEDIDTYEKYCKEHEAFENNKTVATKEKIVKIYHRCLDENDFL